LFWRLTNCQQGSRAKKKIQQKIAHGKEKNRVAKIVENLELADSENAS
jgi:hypothetical protein